MIGKWVLLAVFISVFKYLMFESHSVLKMQVISWKTYYSLNTISLYLQPVVGGPLLYSTDECFRFGSRRV